MKKLLRRLLTLIVLAAAGAGLYVAGEKYLWPPPDLSSIDVVGIVEAPEVNVSSRIAGRIAELNVIEGDQVKRGQVICRIESSDISNQLEHARAELERAKVDVIDAQRTERRYRELVQEKVVAAGAVRRRRHEAGTGASRGRHRHRRHSSLCRPVERHADRGADRRNRREQGAGSRRMGLAGHDDCHCRRPLQHLGAGRRAGNRPARDQRRQTGDRHACRLIRRWFSPAR